ncbi:hypothetical protein BHE74_00045905 [Ensete ventricosum]|nr:hypothetical protein BHE74_00045905 [Ensete ventricosum]
MDDRGLFVGVKGYASSSERRLVDREPRQLPRARVDFWSLVELQSLGVCCEIPRRVDYLWSRNLAWLASLGKTFVFMNVSFHSAVDFPIINACTKAAIKG